MLHHGEIREQGTHQELLAQRGLYWRLFKLQHADGAPSEPAALAADEEESLQSAARLQFSE